MLHLKDNPKFDGKNITFLSMPYLTPDPLIRNSCNSKDGRVISFHFFILHQVASGVVTIYQPPNIRYSDLSGAKESDKYCVY